MKKENPLTEEIDNEVQRKIVCKFAISILIVGCKASSIVEHTTKSGVPEVFIANTGYAQYRECSVEDLFKDKDCFLIATALGR
jgi:hypothetical protein